MDYYIQDDGHTVGPFELSELRQQRLSPSTKVKSDDHADWGSAESMPELQDLWLPAQAPLLPVIPTAKAVTIPALLNLPWNPVWIAWAGFLFTPFWAGLMAALNEQRLGTGKKIILPLTFAAGWLFVDVVIFSWLGWGLIAVLIVMAITVFLLWAYVLHDQQSQYQRIQVSETAERYLLPGLAGIPGLLLICANLYTAATAPDDPLTITKEFIDAAPKERVKYCSSKMRTLLDQADRLVAAGGTFQMQLANANDLFALPPNKYFVPIQLNCKLPNGTTKPTINEWHLQLLADDQGHYQVDDILLIYDSANTPQMLSLCEHREEFFTYSQVVTKSSSPVLKSSTNPKQSTIQRAATKAASRAIAPIVLKILAVLGIASLALFKGFTATGMKREDAT